MVVVLTNDVIILVVVLRGGGDGGGERGLLLRQLRGQLRLQRGVHAGDVAVLDAVAAAAPRLAARLLAVRRRQLLICTQTS